MNVLREVKHLVRAGELSKAYQTLMSGAINRQDHTEAEVLRAELLERLGYCEPGRALAAPNETNRPQARQVSAQRRPRQTGGPHALPAL